MIKLNKSDSFFNFVKYFLSLTQENRENFVMTGYQIDMSGIAPNYQQNVHQIGNTMAWSIILNVAIVCGALRYDRVAAAAHLMFGIIILMMTYISVFYFLGQYGFNANNLGWWYYAHGILGCMMIAFVLMQIIGGLASRFFQQGKTTSILKLKTLRKVHKGFGYFLAIVYKINIVWCWYGYYAFQVLIVWEILWIIAYTVIKIQFPRLQKTITDPQTEDFLCPEIGRFSDIEKVTGNYVIFGNYVYDARQLEQNHPGGFKVIEEVKGREVDRFLYGMYSTELSPQLSAYNHPFLSLQLVGPPIAKIVTPPTFQGFLSEVTDAEIKYMCEISAKTQIYSLGLVQKHFPVRYLGYSDLRQLGQFYSLTYGNVTRLYTAVNFLTPLNMRLMTEVIQTSRRSQFKRATQRRKSVETELPEITKKGSLLTEQLQPQYQLTTQDYVPIMMKIYQNGKMTSSLKKEQFLNIQVKLSQPRGRGLELETTPSGRIVVLMGGTGLFPFSDLIDLLFKAHLIDENHEKSNVLVQNDPILRKKPFNSYFFVFLIALNQPEDIHPITLSQLIGLSENCKKLKVVMRVSKNPEKLSGMTESIEFTREYFNKRVLTEAAEAGLSRIWICGPPKLNSDIGKILLENGHSRDSFLFL